LFACILLASAGTGFVLAAIVPLVPDLRFVIEQVLTVVMFMSGVVFSLGDVPPPLSTLMAYNPVMVVMDDTRDILMYGLWPNWVGLWKVAVISIGALFVGMAFVRRLAPRYPKLAA
jgi:lipopolysaccharide transport system permease protein